MAANPVGWPWGSRTSESAQRDVDLGPVAAQALGVERGRRGCRCGRGAMCSSSSTRSSAGNEAPHRPADDLLGAVPEQVLGGRVPARHGAVEAHRHDGVVRRRHDGAQSRPCLPLGPALGEVAHRGQGQRVAPAPRAGRGRCRRGTPCRRSAGPTARAPRPWVAGWGRRCSPRRWAPWSARNRSGTSDSTGLPAARRPGSRRGTSARWLAATMRPRRRPPRPGRA